jgi:hypothetical protein
MSYQYVISPILSKGVNLLWQAGSWLWRRDRRSHVGRNPPRLMWRHLLMLLPCRGLHCLCIVLCYLCFVLHTSHLRPSGNQKIGLTGIIISGQSRKEYDPRTEDATLLEKIDISIFDKPRCHVLELQDLYSLLTHPQTFLLLPMSQIDSRWSSDRAMHGFWHIR